MGLCPYIPVLSPLLYSFHFLSFSFSQGVCRELYVASLNLRSTHLLTFVEAFISVQPLEAIPCYELGIKYSNAIESSLHDWLARMQTSCMNREGTAVMARRIAHELALGLKFLSEKSITLCNLRRKILVFAV